MGYMDEPVLATLADNLSALLAHTGINKTDLARKSGVSLRMIYNIWNREHAPTIGVVEKLAEPFGLKAWHLLLPGLPQHLATIRRLDRLVEHYSAASEAGRAYIDRVAEQDADYAARHAV